MFGGWLEELGPERDFENAAQSGKPVNWLIPRQLGGGSFK